MSRKPPERDLVKIIWRNFIDSLKPRKSPEELVGTDYLGTKYYEVMADPRIGRRGGRWFLPSKGEDEFDQEIPPEWESWLRGRRSNPPTEDEIKQNLAIAKMKKENAKKLGCESPPDELIGTYPKRPEYELTPGKPQTKK